MTREELAQAIEIAIKDHQPEVCCYGRWDKEDDDGNIIGKRIGYDGAFDLLALADALLISSAPHMLPINGNGSEAITLSR